MRWCDAHGSGNVLVASTNVRSMKVLGSVPLDHALASIPLDHLVDAADVEPAVNVRHDCAMAFGGTDV